MNFSKILLQWYSLNKRDLPWRQTKNPYFIWLSEIILQQTRVEQGISYYLKFICEFPTLHYLAKANQDKVLKLWQGLGYYSRARNLHYSAKYILKYYDGNFPKTYKDILSLKGVGSYTAAAIASFAYDLPYAVVDGNVVRVLSRVFGMQFTFETALGKKEFHRLALDLLDKDNPAENNQAIMEFGALQCTPKSPKCHSCPFISSCFAYTTRSIERLPVKLKKIKIKKRYINYLLIQKDNFVVLDKRNNGIWKGLYELPNIEFSSQQTEQAVLLSFKWVEFFKSTKYKIELVSDEYIHKLSHQHIYAKFWLINVQTCNINNQSFIEKSKLKNYPVSKLMDKFFKEYNII